jgi:hypothetical protein
MKIVSSCKTQRQQGNILAYLILLMVLAAAIASVGAYVAQTTNVAHRRSDMIAAQQYAQGGATIGCADLNAAYMNQTNSFPNNLATGSRPYTLNAGLSTGSLKVYERTVSAVFTNQAVTAQIWLTNAAAPTGARIVASSTVGKVTQTATVNLRMTFGNGAAILSVNKGTSDQGVAKSAAQDGNVVVNGGGTGGKGLACYLIVDGGTGSAIDANGQVNVDTSATVPPGSISKTNWGSGNQIPDYTGQGTANSLFDFNRLIAVADLTSNSTTFVYNTNTHNNHFTNVATFANAIRVATNHFLEGVIVVDLRSTDKNWGNAGASGTFPFGINVRGTLFYNFGPEFGPLDKFIMDADLNVNAANLSGVVATNPATYATGYPPVYSNPSNNPVNIDITSKGFANFGPADDLPALLYSIGEVDIHGNANVCGVTYTPSYMEVENKGPAGSVQYFKGMVIMGQGIYLENTTAGSTSIISYDRQAIDNLSTAGSNGKTLVVSYWQ